MKQSVDIEVWKYLFNRLSDSEKKILLQNTNLRINNMQSSLITKKTQWGIFLKLASSNLTKGNIQNAIINYYLENTPNLKQDIDNKEDSLEELSYLEEKDFKSIINKHGFMYVLIYLLSNGKPEQINNFYKYKPEENTNNNKNDFLEVEDSTNQIQELKYLESELNNNNKIIKALKKKNATFEEKYRSLEMRKAEELVILEKKYNSDLEEIINSTDIELKNHEIKLNKLIEENKLLKNQLDELNKLNQVNVDIVETPSKEYKKKKVLILGTLPLLIQKDERYNFETFESDYSNYSFDENYDEYWIIEDKLSAKEKKHLRNNTNSKKVEFIKKNYNELIRK